MDNLSATTLVELLEQHASGQSEKLAFEFLENRNKSVKITYGELAQRARAIAVSLLKDLNPGDRALLLYAPGIDYITGFFGCLYAGVIAVPAYPPTTSRTMGRLLSIVEDAGTRVALTTSDLMLRIRLVSLGVKDFRGLKWIATNKVKDKLASQWGVPKVTAQTLAFLQYTSGSTSTPKGVMLSHGNLLSNLDMIYDVFGLANETRAVFWLPPYHDMGLIGAILGSASAGHACTLMSPVSFIKDPISWLEILSDRRATHSGGPNFAYDLCVRKLSTRKAIDLDLSQWRIALNGAEPIRPETIDRFSSTFAPYGFRKEAFLPAYGLAEATLYVSGTQGLRARSFSGASIDRGVPHAVDDAGEDTRTLIGCGFGAPGLELAIVDPETTEKRRLGEIGEIWVKGASVAQGYWGRLELSKECFQARIASDDSGPFLRTGDLGFFHQDELFIAGRSKDLLIIRGRNHYPQDLELTMEQSHSAIRPGGCAAFSFEQDNEEQLGVACELQKSIKKADTSAFTDEIVAAIREGIALQHQVEPRVIVLLKAGTIPKTSSGKIQRHAVKYGFLNDKLAPLATSRASSETTYWSALEKLDFPPEKTESAEHDNPTIKVVSSAEQTIRHWLAQAISKTTQRALGEIDPHKPVLSYGMDSVSAVELVAQLEAWLDIPIDAALVYEHPTISQIARFLAAQRPDMGDRELDSGFQNDWQEFSIVPSSQRERYKPFPLTEIQKAYLAGRSQSFELGGIGTAGWVMVETELNIPRLARAWNLLIKRHEMLRAIFTPDGQQMILLDVPDYRIEVENLLELEAKACEQRLDEEKERLSTRVFSPSIWPLFELKAFETRDRGTVLAINIDMLIVDGFSINLLEQELLHAYHRPESPLPEIHICFRDYVLKLGEMRKSRQYQQAREYWLSRAKDLPEAPRLPMARPTSEIAEPAFARREKTFAAPETRALEMICRSCGLQLPAMLATAYARILSIWSNQNKLTLNFTVFNRYPLHPDVFKLVGDFTSILLVDVDLSDNRDFLDLVKQTQHTIGTSLRHRHYDGVELIKELSIAKGRHGQALMPIVFTSMLYSGSEDSTQGLKGSLGAVFAGQSRTPQVMLDNQVSMVDGSLRITWDYPVDLFDKQIVEEMFEQYTTFLSAIAEGDLPFDPGLPARHRRLLEIYNSTSEPIPEVTLDSLFSRAAKQHPTATAIEYGNAALTYGELDRLSNQIAKALVKEGIGRGDFVAVLGESDPMTIANILATCKIGAAYVPVEPTYPEERKRTIIENSGCRIELNSRFYQNAGCENHLVTPQEQNHLPSDVAYIIYTSGSTGRPKGVVITHRAAANTVQDINARYGVSTQDRILLISSLGFDLSVYDLFGAFAAGATLVLAPFGKDLAALSRKVKDRAITIWNSVPAILDLTLDAAGPDYRCESLRVALLSGDWIPLPLFDKARRAFPRLSFHSLGGATEGSIWSIHFPVKGIDPTWKSIPYGYPLANQQFHVLDFDRRPCPIGVEGELYIGGMGVAVEYKNNQEETDRSFFDHPTLGRVYRTGDMGVFREQGYIEFLGRRDHQVKIRGYRIELGEIETRLLEHPAISSAVVVDREDPSGAKYLAAYLVGSDPTDERELRQLLKKTLPDYMIPSFFSYIDKLPLSANGKVDRQALPDPSVHQRESSKALAPEAATGSSNLIQDKLIEIWKRVIGVDRVEVTDNFFHLGGDSLMAQQLINEVRKAYDLTIPMGELFRRQTIADICEYLKEHLPQLAAPSPIRATAEQTPPKLLDPHEIFGTLKDLYAQEFPEQIILDSEQYAEFKKQALHRTFAHAGDRALELDRDHRWPEDIENRRTIREFEESTPIDFNTFSRLLTVFRQRRRGQSATHYYGSAGGLYPMDVFVWFKPNRVEGVEPGLYYYNPLMHCLELVNDKALMTQSAHFLRNQEVFRSSAFSVFLIYDAKANMPVYNSSGYLFACIEAGMMTQLLSQAAERLGLGLCSIGELDFPSIRAQFHLQDHHVLIHSMECGRKPSADSAAREKRPPQQDVSSGPKGSGRAVSSAFRIEKPPTPNIPLVDRTQPIPLSSTQRRLWFIDQYDSTNSTYNMPAAVQLSGPLDVERLRQSFQVLMERHEILRTRFVSEGGIPRQVVDPAGPWSLPLVDLSELSEREAATRAMEMIVQKNAEPFDLCVAPLWQTTVYRLAALKYILGISIHHIISDGWSAAVLMRDIQSIYSGFTSGSDPDLPKLLVQYADFAAWQASVFNDDRLRDQFEYWRTALADLPPLELPLGKPRPVQIHFQGALHQFEIPSEIVAGLRAFCQQHQATVFMGLLGAFQVVLAHLTNSRDIPIGTPVAGRPLAELEPLIGFFANTLVIRTRIEDNPTFPALLTKVRQAVFEALENQEVPFDRLVDALEVDRDPGRTPLFQVMFALQPPPLVEAEFSDLTMASLPVNSAVAKFDIAVVLYDHDNVMTGQVEYSTALFEGSTIARMFRYFVRMLELVLATPGRPVLEHSLLDEDERRTILEDWNSTQREPSQDRLLHELVAKHAKDTPGDMAVQDEYRTLTYQQLDHRANQLAHVLRGIGVGPEVIVGLCLPRSVDLVIGILAILKAGGAYLPLDPSYPAARLSFMLEDSETPILVTDSELLSKLPPQDLKTVLLDVQSAEIDEASAVPVAAAVTPDNLAYIIYTSGSTGRPKGVQLHHRGLSNLVYSLAKANWVHKHSRFLQFSALSFDASVAEIAPTLGMGGTLVIPSRETLLSPEQLARFIDEKRVEAAIIPPAMLKLFEEDTLPLKLLIVAGEQCPIKLAQKWAPGRTFINGYGPTENTVCSTYHVFGETLDDPPPIGKPISNVSCYVLNEALEPVPPGTIGELFVGGLNVGRGYLKRPGDTARSFLPDPFSLAPGARLYRTGDLVRWQAGGTLLFVGRIDDQIKVRGFRIELGEIEAHLSNIKGISAAAVIAERVSDGNHRLIAYVVAENGPMSPDHLRSQLIAELPDYMIPAAFVFLDSLPLSPSGKVDRKTLPAANDADFTASNEVRFSSTPTEIKVYGIWRELLGLEQFSVDDDFFALGGHSLLATQVVSRLIHLFKVEIPVRVLFEASTVAKLAARLDELLNGDSNIQSITPINRAENILPSLAQERLWFLDQLEPHTSKYNISGAFRLKGELDGEAFERSIATIFERHELLSASFTNRAGRPHVTLDLSIKPQVERRDISRNGHSDEADLREFLEEFCSRTFSLDRPPLIRIAIVRRAHDEHIVALNMHHIISDGWSVFVLISDLIDTYNSLTQGAVSNLPPLEAQYVDYAAWQRTYLAGERHEALATYWSEKLSGAPSLLQLPADRPRPPVQTFTGRCVERKLDATLCKQLEQLSRQGSSTLFMTLLSGFYGLMHRLTGQDDIVVGTPIAGRNRSELENLVGFFLNLLPLRVQLDSNTTFEQLLRATRETTLNAYAYQDLPFEQIIERVKPERSLAHTPLFQVFFNMLEFPFAQKELAGLTIEPMDTPDLGSKFDITSYVSPQDDGSLTLRWVYNADLFDEQRMAGMLDQYERLLKAVVCHPEAPLSSHSLLTKGARTPLPDPTIHLDDTWHGPIQAALTAQVAEHPERLAVEDENGSSTYGELEVLSNRLAHWLMETGLHKGEAVAIWAHRSFALVRGILGVLKAGGAFLVLDPAYPESRLRQYLEIADPKALVCLEEAGPLPDELSSFVREKELTRLDLPALGQPDPDQLTKQCDLAPGIQFGPDDIATVTFTSGSTGEPKAVLGRHGALTHFLPWQTQRFGLNAHDRFSLLSGLAHDPLQRDIFTAVWCGAAIIAPRQEQILEPGWLLEWAATKKVTVANLTPAMAGLLTDHSSRHGDRTPSSLRLIFLVGERLLKQDVLKLKTHAPNVTIVNLYGTTETQRALGHFVVDDAVNLVQATVPLGNSMPDVQLLIVNQHGQLCAVGELGEIWIRSPHLAAGYLGEQALADSRFLVSPFTGDPVDRVYRTGDLGRYRPDGIVDFAGRADHQVKIRGFRVELGEVEAVLLAGVELRECAAVLHGEGASGRIIAYAVPCDGELDVDSLKRRVKERLPDYMWPAAYVSLDRLPMTPNGKLDRRALPSPDLGERQSKAVLPRTRTEELLCPIVGELLGLETVGITDDFFDLGGHSLLATQTISRIRDTFQVDLPLRVLFEGPTVAELAERVDGLLTQGHSVERIVAVPRHEKMPLSLAQERLWFLDQFEAGSSTYNMFGAFRVKGDLDPSLVERCVAALFERHELLGAFFTSSGGIPKLAFDKDVAPLMDRREIPFTSDNEDPELRNFIAEFAARPFDLNRPPLIRVALIRRSHLEHVVALSMHHIISDGWSLTILMRDLVESYNGIKCNESVRLPNLPVQYADYATWQRTFLVGERLEELAAYWSEKLASAAPVLELPTDRPRPPVQTFTGRCVERKLDVTLCKQLEQLSRQGSSTLFMTLLSGFYGLMHRLSGQDDIVVGTPIAGRNRSELENLVGFFLNLLPLRVQLDSNTTFEQLLRATRETTLNAYAYQDLPFEQIIEKVKPERSLAHTPLFQVLFNMLEFPFAKKELAGLAIEPMETPDLGSKFDITSYVVPEDDGSLTLRWVYNADLFDEQRIAGMLDQYELLLKAVVCHPEAPLSSHPLLTEGARTQLPDPTVHLDNTWHGPIQAALTAQAAEHPERLGVEDENGRATYGELEGLSNRLAHWLMETGLHKGEVVAIWAHRCGALVRGIFGVLKAGGAFLVLDPAYPESRLRRYLEIAQPKALVCLQEAGPLPDALSSFVSAQGLPLIELPALGGQDPETLAKQDNIALAIDIGPDDIAVVTFTSGSTGQPKAVLGRHGPLTHFLSWQTDKLELTSNDRFSLLSGLAHDPLQRDIFTALWCGAAIIAPRQKQILEPGWLSQWMRERRVTVAHLTPAMVQLISTKTIEEGTPPIPSLRLALTVGDRLLKQDVLKLSERAPHVTIVNMYGSTETQRAVGHYIILDPTSLAQEVVPVGHGMPDVQLLIVNQHGKLCAVGELGEIWVRSPHLAAGYLGDQTLTHSRFMANPFTGDPDDRIYRTGDLGRYRPNGIVEFAGRADHQVKIRGFRVELGEVEAALLAGAELRECAVVHHGEGASGRIIAYAVPCDGELDVDSLKRRVKGRLPDYMWPAAYVPLDRIPLTPNGKLDKKALPTPDLSEPQSKAAPPRTQTEEILCAILAELLGLEAVGITDDFFDLGGHSLLATQAISRIRDAFQVDLPLRVLFEGPTVEAISWTVDNLRTSDSSVAPAIQRVSREQSIPLSFSQQRLWFIQQLDSASITYNMPSAIRLRGELDVERLRQCFEQVVVRHEVLRTSLVSKLGKPIQVINEPSRWNLNAQDLTDLAKGEREQESMSRITQFSKRPFDLERDLLLRTELYKLSENEHILCCVMHHVASDGWSIPMLINEVSVLYAAFSEGRPSPLAELEIQYADFSVWQREWLSGDVLETKLSYWKTQLAKVSPLDLPTDKPRTNLSQSPAGRVSIDIAEELSARLYQIAKETHTTPFMVLFAAFATVLHRMSHQDDFCIGVPIAGRNRSELEKLIGFFVNSLPLRVDFSGNPTFSQLLHQVRSVALGAYANQEVPFERIVDELDVERDLSRNPVFQTMFVLQNQPIKVSRIADIEASAIETGDKIAKFDLTLELIPDEKALHGAFEYNADLFDVQTIERFGSSYSRLLSLVVENSDRRVLELPLLDPDERQRLLVDWNATSTPISDECVHQQFERRASRAPDAIAVWFEDTCLTYRELDQRANQLAHRLVEHGVGPEVWVGLCLERSLDMVVALLAVLKSGGAYVPIDPIYPPGRIAMMFEDSGISALVTQQSLLEKLPKQNVPTVCLDTQRLELDALPNTSVKATVNPLNLAYVIYTSGSTGRPKGVQISHQALTNFIGDMGSRMDLGSNDRVLAVTTLCFDISGLEIYAPLVFGASVVVVPKEVSQDGERLIQLIEARGATWLQATPSTWRLLLEAGWKETPSLCAMCGGEPWPLELAKELKRRTRAVWNFYGPTETTIYSAVWRLPPKPTKVLLGTGIANTTLYVLDKNLEPVPPRVAGELFIGGAGLSRGYLNRPSLTAEKFIPDPLSGAPGARMYRTGDLVRHLDNGILEFICRVDHQIKVRGFRIELGEIEARLAELEEVEQCVVAVQKEKHDQNRIVAYLVIGNRELRRHSDIRSSLKMFLPDYMIPSAFVVMEKLPQTPNGKIDLRALPDPDIQISEGIVVAPRNSTEQAIRGICQEVLSRDGIGIYDNFFDIGGHSLLAAQVVARVQEAFEVKIRIVDLFERPTVAGLAEIVDALLLSLKVKGSYEHGSGNSEDREEGEI